MLALAGLPGTAGFIGKLFLIQASVAADFTWLGVAIAIGTMVSLAYYLRVIAYVWMQPAEAPEPDAPGPLPAMAGGSPETDGVRGQRGQTPDGRRCKVIIGFTVLATAATVFFGVVPAPLTNFAESAGEALAASVG
jgi:NADH-quinone oxidoreductase subunit N